MNDETYEAQKARVRRLAQPTLEALGMGIWHFTYNWCREGIRQTDRQRRKGEHALLQITVSPLYRTAELDVSLPHVLDLEDDEELGRLLLHEWGHLLLNELQWKAQHERRRLRPDDFERAASTVGNALQGMHRLGIREERQQRKTAEQANSGESTITEERASFTESTNTQKRATMEESTRKAERP